MSATPLRKIFSRLCSFLKRMIFRNKAQPSIGATGDFQESESPTKMIFHEAANIPDLEKRCAFLNRACGANAERRKEVVL